MALFCLGCFNKIEGLNLTYDDVVCDIDFCEKCKKNDYCVVSVKNKERREDIDEF